MTISSGYTASGNNNHKRQLKRSWQGRLGMVDVPALRGWREWVFFFFFSISNLQTRHDSSIMLLTICSKCILKDNQTLILLFPKAAKIEIFPPAGFLFSLVRYSKSICLNLRLLFKNSFDSETCCPKCHTIQGVRSAVKFPLEMSWTSSGKILIHSHTINGAHSTTRSLDRRGKENESCHH